MKKKKNNMNTREKPVKLQWEIPCLQCLDKSNTNNGLTEGTPEETEGQDGWVS